MKEPHKEGEEREARACLKNRGHEDENIKGETKYRDMNDSGREARERERWPPSPPPPPHGTTSLSISTRAPWHISRHWGWQQTTHCSESIRRLQPPQSTLSCRLVMYPDATWDAGVVRKHVPHVAHMYLSLKSWLKSLSVMQKMTPESPPINISGPFCLGFTLQSHKRMYLHVSHWKSKKK